MPELPEVETTLRGTAPHLTNQPITALHIRTPKLRQPTPKTQNQIIGQTILKLERRAKYILLHLSNQTTLLLHLGMSGRLTINKPQLEKHDHIILQTPKAQITLTDPRRFGLFLHIPTQQLLTHPLLKNLGPEPLDMVCLAKTVSLANQSRAEAPSRQSGVREGGGITFTPTYLHQVLKTKSTAIKPTLMDNKVVVGVGNIYASESLFRSKIHPQTPANQLTKPQLTKLIHNIQATLTEAIAAGGSSLKDFQHTNGQLGYFQNQFNVYGRHGKPCFTCQNKILKTTQAQRATFHCPTCQPIRKVRP